jgi:hypothetical protein
MLLSDGTSLTLVGGVRVTHGMSLHSETTLFPTLFLAETVKIYSTPLIRLLAKY